MPHRQQDGAMFKNAIALNFQIPTSATEQAALPEWLELVPAGRITGRDGRLFINDQPDRVLAFNNELNRDIVIDIEHASYHKAPKGEPAPGQGWIVELENRDGAIWGRVEWNAAGTELIRNREYRYYSPAFICDQTDHVRGIHSVGLTNRQNLDLPALNHQSNSEEQPMDKILLALALAATATQDDVVTAINKLKTDVALNAEKPPSLDKFVPRADYDAVTAKRDELQVALNAQQKEKHDAQINTLVDDAIKAGKITPATREFYVATCNQQDGIEQFKKFVEAQPVITDATNLDGKQVEQGSQVALNSEQQKINSMFGNSTEDLKKYA
jgi:phage I-like protein